MIYVNYDPGLWLCRPSRPLCPAGPGCGPRSWPGNGSRRPSGGRLGSCMPSTSESKVSAARDRQCGVPVSPTRRGKFTIIHQNTGFTRLSQNYRNNFKDTIRKIKQSIDSYCQLFFFPFCSIFTHIIHIVGK